MPLETEPSIRCQLVADRSEMVVCAGTERGRFDSEAGVGVLDANRRRLAAQVSECANYIGPAPALQSNLKMVQCKRSAKIGEVGFSGGRHLASRKKGG